MGNRVELDEMGKRILDASRTDLYLSMRFLGPALHSLGFIMDLSTTTVGTDAAYIRFNPNHLFRLYVDRPRRLNRTYLHMILHCVFRHMFTARKKEDRELWDLSCDIAVTSIIDSMDYRAVAELTPEFRQRVYDRLQEEIHVLTAERIYQYFLERKRNYMEELQLAAAFALDDHSFWERMEDEENRDPEDGSKSDQDPDDEKKQDRDPGTDSPDEKGADQKTPGDNEEKKDSESTSPDSRDPSGQDRDPGRKKSGQDSPSGRNKKDSPNGKKKDRGADPPDRDGKGDGKNRRDSDRDPGNRDAGGRRQNRRLPRLKSAEELEGDWKETSRRMEAEILASGKEASDERGSLDRILSISNRRRTDYREFLRKFAILREVTTIDPDSFDYGFYHYGLEMYGNMPLIEENEYREMNNLRTLVIAIDTSASCQDVLVQRFLNETASVLRSIGQFFATSSVYIVECDEHVQQEILLHGPDDLEKYASAFHVKGGFGTDFRPVFAWVEEKRRTGEIGDMQALMYFTDGMGVYPEKPTDYDTAFVFFNDEEMDDTKVPDWAVRLYIDGEKIKARTHRYGDGT
jgi:predicted metal-dependent peptidase